MAAPYPEPTFSLAVGQNCRAREILDLVANKWSLGVVDTLEAGPQRFGELKRGIAGISQKMLTSTVRELERDGIITRTVYAVMPPNVVYGLTDLGKTLLAATRPLVRWSLENMAAIDDARSEFDERSREIAPGRPAK
ncbi:helix-turn-helix domain-containing protein [Amycolatopsis sp. NPDC005232]|uniref:winged helix-turn-helix transcriptional regulator n=1 Tax=Amycolatopsis sp. NPDC005232 TaxID=3157027 RepID=UPI0033AB9ABD